VSYVGCSFYDYKKECLTFLHFKNMRNRNEQFLTLKSPFFVVYRVSQPFKKNKISESIP
jgi:hypothetical protein